MTRLKTPVRRETPILLDHRREPRQSDNVIVTLYPHGEIGFQQHGKRREYRLPLGTAYLLAMQAAGETRGKQR